MMIQFSASFSPSCSETSTTGIYNNGQWWKPHLPDLVTIPVHFRRNGYAAVGSGKIFHHTAGNNPPNQWNEFQPLRFRDDPWFRGVKLNYPWSDYGPAPDGFPFSGVEGLGHENDWGSLPIADTEYDDVRTADYAVRFLMERQDDNRPSGSASGRNRWHLQFAGRTHLNQSATAPANPKISADVVERR